MICTYVYINLIVLNSLQKNILICHPMYSFLIMLPINISLPHCIMLIIVKVIHFISWIYLQCILYVYIKTGSESIKWIKSIAIPNSQSGPSNPAGHLHAYSFGPMLIQTPLFWHGVWLPQKSKSMIQNQNGKQVTTKIKLVLSPYYCNRKMWSF